MASPEHENPASERRGLRRTAARAGAIARAVLRALGFIRRVARGLAILALALIIVFEEWGWRPLAAMMARLARFPFVARLEAAVAALPPYGALTVFAVPSLLLLPLKLVALWLIAGGHLVAATMLFVFAKIAGTALLAYIFNLTQPSLMRLAWFRWAYETVMPWKYALTEAVRSSWAWRYGRVVKAGALAALKRAFRRVRPLLERATNGLRAALSGVRTQGRLALARIRQWIGAMRGT